MEHHPIRKYLAPVGLAMGLGAGMGAAYAANTPTEIQVGPHKAVAEVTADHTYVADFGPLGNITLPNRHGPLGARVTIEDIPSEQASAEPFDYNAIASQYEQLFADPQHVLDRASNTVRERVFHDAELGGLQGLVALAGILALSRSLSTERKQALRTGFAISGNSAKRMAVIGTSVALLSTCVQGSTAGATSGDHSVVDHVFDHTPLEGASIHGLYLQGLVDHIAPQVIDYVERTNSFYDIAKSNFEIAFENANIPTKDDGSILMQVISDNHCNIGMNRVHGAVALKFGVNLTGRAGDEEMSGSAAEEECIASAADSMPGDTLQVAVGGNHDEAVITGDQERRHGFTVMNGAVQVVTGFKFLGDSDPRRSGFGDPALDNNSPLITLLGQRMVNVACQQHPDILLVHDPQAGKPTAQAGCAKFVISGHTHVQEGPITYHDGKGNTSYQFTQGTSGGAKEDSIVLGPLQAAAVESVLKFSKDHQYLGRYDITVNPDESVVISDFIPSN